MGIEGFFGKIKERQDGVLKLSLTIIESVCFVLLIVFVVYLSGQFIAGTYYSVWEAGDSPAFIGLIVCLLIFLSSPFLIRFMLYFIDNQISLLHYHRFKDQFIQDIKHSSRINIKMMAESYQIKEQQIRDYIAYLAENGVLRGTFQREAGFGEVFNLDPSYPIKSIYEKRIDYFNENIAQFLKAYKIVALAKIAAAFQLPEGETESLLRKSLASGIIKGYLDAGNFVHELSVLVDSIKPNINYDTCMFCDRKIMPNSLYCSHCGRNQKAGLDENI